MTKIIYFENVTFQCIFLYDSCVEYNKHILIQAHYLQNQFLFLRLPNIHHLSISYVNHYSSMSIISSSISVKFYGYDEKCVWIDKNLLFFIYLFFLITGIPKHVPVLLDWWRAKSDCLLGECLFWVDWKIPTRQSYPRRFGSKVSNK